MVMGADSALADRPRFPFAIQDFRAPSNLDLTAVHVTASGDYSPPELKAATQSRRYSGYRNALHQSMLPVKSGLTFADSVENATDIAVRFRAAGVSAEVLYRKNPGCVTRQCHRHSKTAR